MAKYRRRRRRRRGRAVERRRMWYVAGVCAVFFVLALAAWWWSAAPPGVVARVLFSETANCTSQERRLVAGVIRNRIGMAAFGSETTLAGVVMQRGAFSCVNDAGNTNWVKTRHPALMTGRERAVWEECLLLANGAIPEAVGPSGRPLVYYHDKSIGMPRSWDNDKWRAVAEVTTTHFVFYSIVAVRR